MKTKDLVVAAALLVAIAYLLCGFVARNVVLGRNPCEMTYSTFAPNGVPSVDVPEGLLRDIVAENVFIENTNSSTIAIIDGYLKHIFPRNKRFKLLKYSDPRINNATLNVNPVLFVPGHQGHFNQVRSLASTKHHNKDSFFQYFSLDFGVSHSGYHANDIVTQAVYTNMAINRIYQLYKEKASNNNQQLLKDDFKLMVIGHSMGSIVARTAVLLNNYPKCLVSDIIMISSPNLYSPYTAHGSLDSLFTKVNKAWYQSYYNESKRCVLHRDSVETESDESGNSNLGLKLNLECPICPSRTRLISITGGELDVQVPPHLTRLDPITPIPRNSTIDNKKAISGKGAGTMQWLFRITYNFLGMFTKSLRALAALVPGAASNSSNPVVEAHIMHGNDTMVVTDVNASKEEVPTLNTSKLYANYEDVTMEQWSLHMSKYIDGQHLSLRSSQLVGYPLDHYAILWCRQFLAALTSGMRRIVSSNPKDIAALIDIFKLKNVPTAALVQDRPAFIPSIYNYLVLNDTLVSWSGSAASEEYQYILKNSFYKLHDGSSTAERVVNQIFANALLYHTHYLSRVLLFYLIVCLLSLNTLLFRRLCSIDDRIISNDWTVMHPFTHLHIDVLYRGGMNVLSQLIPANLASYIFNKTTLMVVVPILIARFVYDCVYNTAVITHYTSEAFTWLVSYGIAIVMRAFLLTVVYAFRYFAGMCNSLVQLIMSPFKLKLSMKWTSMRVLGLAAAGLSIIIYTTSSRFTVLPTWTYVQTVLLLLGICLFYLTMLVAIVHPPDSSYNYFQITQLTLLYLPVIALSYPSLITAIDALYSDNHYDCAILAPVLSELFGPDELNHLCITYVVWWHLSVSCVDGYNSLADVKPIVWLIEVFGGDNHALFPSMTAASNSKSKCIHEDGGKYAIFEYIKDADVTEQCVTVARNVTLGPTIRVVSCNCALDKSLKNQSEWCEWCLCRKCGGKNLPRQQYSTDHTLGGDDFNVHFGYCLLLNVLVFSMFYFIKEHFYKYTYVVGTVALLSIVRDKLAARNS